MSEAKHTPGPWDQVGPYAPYTIIGPESEEIAKVYPLFGAQEANARLIAAAPELLAELQALVARNFGQPHGVTVPALDKARALIARATGH